MIGTTDRRAAVAQLLAVIGPRVAHVCAADRWSMVVKCNDSNLVQRRNAQPGAASNGRCLASRTASSMLPCALASRGAAPRPSWCAVRGVLRTEAVLCKKRSRDALRTGHGASASHAARWARAASSSQAGKGCLNTGREQHKRPCCVSWRSARLRSSPARRSARPLCAASPRFEQCPKSHVSLRVTRSADAARGPSWCGA